MAHIATVALVAVTLTGAITDATRGKVYNWLTYPTAALGLCIGLVAGQQALLESAGGLCAGLLLFGTLRRIGRMGAGDVKLMAAVGALKGPVFLVFASFYVIVAAGLGALVILAMKRRLIPTLRWAASLVLSSVIPGVPAGRLEAETMTMPFAPAIFVRTTYCVILEAIRGPFSF